MSTEPTVLLSKSNGIATVTLNRPSMLNAITRDVVNRLTDCFNDIENDDDIKVVILTGAGKAFCAGVDLKSLQTDREILVGNLGPDAAVVTCMTKCSKPIIGAVNGAAVTGGFELALACDFIYASKSAKFADTHARVGILPGWGLSQKFPRLVGINRARELSFTGNFFSAEQAKEWGLVNEVFDDDELLQATTNMAQQIASTIPDALFRIKAMMNEGWQMSLADGLDLEGERSNAYMSDVDFHAMEERLASLRSRSKTK